MKSYMEKAKLIGTFILTGMLVASCGGGHEVEGGLPGTGAGIGGGAGDPGSNPPRTIVITEPFSDAIENLGAGVYRQLYTAIVEDKEGNAVPDGTQINLFVIDTVKAMGVIEAGTDTISASTLSDAIPYLGDGYTPTTYNGAVVNRDGTSFVVAPNDHLVLINAARGDKARLISSIAANSVTTSTAYMNNYPNSLYPGNVPVTPPSAVNPLSPESSKNTYYYIGASKNGAYVEGEDGKIGVTTTKGGKAIFYLVYPSHTAYILNGCTSIPDPRTDPAGATDTFIIASAANNLNVSAIRRTCFYPIAGGTLTASTSKVGASTIITLTARDGGDKTYLPYTAVGYVIDASGGANVAISLPATSPYGFVTNGNGSLDVEITAAATATGNTANIVFSTADASVAVAVEVPVPPTP